MRRIVDAISPSHAAPPFDDADDGDGAAMVAHRNAPVADPASLHGLIGDVAHAGSEGTEALTQIPARTTALLMAETDPGRVHDLLQSEIHAALEQLSRANIGASDAVAG